MTRYSLFNPSDSEKSHIGFKLPFPRDRKLEGFFTDFEATLILNKSDLTSATLKMVLYCDSIRTDARWLTHRLMGRSCLNVVKHRQITFESIGCEKLTDREYLLFGTITICGKRKIAVFEVNDQEASFNSRKRAQMITLQFEGAIKPSHFKLNSKSVFAEEDDEVAIEGSVSFKCAATLTPSGIQGNNLLL